MGGLLLPQLIDVVYNVLFGLATMILAAYFSEGWFVVIWVVIIFGSPWCAAANVALPSRRARVTHRAD